jgi:hypothetical protein
MNKTVSVEQSLSKFPNAKKIAVSNFVGTLSGNMEADIDNTYLDAEMYGWNEDTILAILHGIETYYLALN